MKSKHALQLFFSLMMLFTLFGGIQPAQASDNLANRTDVSIITHDLSYWNATYIGSVDAVTYERWQFAFTEPHTFVVTAAPVASNLIPLIRLLDANGNELAHSTGSLASSQPVGSYFVQIQPQTGSGFYILTLRDAAQVQPSVSTAVNPTTINVGANTTATVSLNNIPSTGYTSAEFTCTYNASLGQVSNIAVGGLFGTDPVVAVNGPQNGSFIIAIAGSNGNKALTSGTAFTFNVKGLQAGQIVITCTSRISKGDNVLSSILSSPASLVVQGNTPTPTSTRTSTPISALTSTATSLPTSTRTASPTFTQGPTSNVTASPTSTLTVSPTVTQASNVTGSPTVTSLPSFTPLPTFTRTITATITATATTTATGSPTVTSLPSFTPLPTFTRTATVTPGPSLTSTPSATGILTGKVLASKPVTVGLYDAGNTLVSSITTNTDGSFSLTAPIGTYSVLASASGFLGAQASATLTSGATATLPTVSLLAGDIDNNKVIDQFDAMTIGMNYNASSPSAADLNNDGTINILDLELLARNYHQTGPTAWQ